MVRSGSATQAAAQLGINHTTVYQRIVALEDRLGKSLFERSSSGWVLTPVGERIAHHTRRLNEQEKRNIRRFPLDFCFQLTREEYAILRSQFAISKGRGAGGTCLMCLPSIIVTEGEKVDWVCSVEGSEVNING